MTPHDLHHVLTRADKRRSMAVVCAGIAVALACMAARASEYTAGPITIRQPHARATVGAQPTGAGYMTLQNRGGPDRLVAAAAAVSSAVELHSMTKDGSMMRMRRLESIELPAGATVALEPGGLHMMFVGLKAPLKAGSSFPLTLRFEKAGEAQIQVSIE